jgi:hypothetical protein
MHWPLTRASGFFSGARGSRSGVGGILNVPVGCLLVTAVLQATATTPARTIGSSTVFAGAITPIRAAVTVELPDNEGVAAAHELERLGESRTG